MSLPVIILATLVVLFVGYRLYGGFVARQYALDPGKTTPASEHNDGVDFVPTRPFYLLGQHFSAIAAAGPIAGPILACQQFGWLPCILWIAIGAVLIGAVHDFSVLVASVRHDGRSIAEVIRTHLGSSAWLAIMGFIWIALIYVLVAFADVTATTFVTRDTDMAGFDTPINLGGAVALASTMYLLLAVIMGLVDRFLRPPLWLSTVIFVPATLFVVWLGTQASTFLVLGWQTWIILIMAYCAIASVVPVWALLQPRGYLGGFVLYMALLVGTVGLFFGGYTVEQSAFKGFDVGGTNGALFPFLFVTIACGACSGFHGLVCSGTTSKQIASEPDCKPIGYGAMLLEAFVALIALSTIMIASHDGLAGKGPGTIYGEGLGRFMVVLIGEKHLLFAVTFGAMAFSTFIFDTIDVGTRLGRMILQELFGWQGRLGAIAATALTCGVPLLFLLGAQAGSYKLFWALFGTSNQLLAGLSLLAITVWLKRTGRRSWYTLAPAVFVLAITLWSLLIQTRNGFEGGSTIAMVNGIVCAALILLAILIVGFGVRASGTVAREPA